MRISDWSSDVCSSDLDLAEQLQRAAVAARSQRLGERREAHRPRRVDVVPAIGKAKARPHPLARAIGRVDGEIFAAGLGPVTAAAEAELRIAASRRQRRRAAMTAEADTGHTTPPVDVPAQDDRNR